MKTLTVKNYRAFGEDEQTARLTPLTLLVGENNTGKTSFMALLRALWDVAYGEAVPNFQEEPFDLGSFNDIVHNRGKGEIVPKSFSASFTTPDGMQDHQRDSSVTFEVHFEQADGAPYPTHRRFANNQISIQAHQGWHDENVTIKYATKNTESTQPIRYTFPARDRFLFPARLLALFLEKDEIAPYQDVFALRGLMRHFQDTVGNEVYTGRHPYASAPIRSQPQRTYNPGVPIRDPEGEYAATFIAQMSQSGGDEWKALKQQLIDFGRNSGLFDEIEIRQLGDSYGDPFQIRLRIGRATEQNPFRNLADVGYGVNQILPVLTDLLKPDSPRLFLIQQPEIHLHPSAQAALGTLFCSLAVSRKQLIVETHSDHLIDRVRMSVRDGVSGIKPEDVSILYFERGELDVRIHSISIDRKGNIIGAPEDYRRFFMEEVERSIGLRTLGNES